MPTIPGILASAVLCLACQSCQSISAADTNRLYVNGLPCTPELEAELEQTSQRLLSELQALASQCKDVRLVIDWTWLLGDRLQGTEVPLQKEEKTELLCLISRMQPVKANLDMDITEAYGLDLQFTMPDGSTRTCPYPDVVPLSKVSADGYASMCWFALPDADAARWYALDKHNWIQQRIEQVEKTMLRP